MSPFSLALSWIFRDSISALSMTFSSFNVWTTLFSINNFPLTIRECELLPLAEYTRVETGLWIGLVWGVLKSKIEISAGLSLKYS